VASLFKLRVTRYVNAEGKRVKKDTPGARKVQEKSKKWYGDYKDANGITRRVPLKTDKAASQAKLNELVRNEERRSAGLFDPYEEHRRRPLTEHIDEYEEFLNSKGNSEQHVGQTIARIRKLATACKFRSLPDIDAPKIANWLARRRKKSARFSAQTSNFYLDCFKYFCNWLVTYDRIPKNPVSMLQRVNVDTDRRHDRRSLADEEFVRLVEAARNGRRAEGVQGKDRAMLYILAAWTGYRRRELASLTRRSFELTADPPVIRVRAAYSKRRREDAVPLHDYVVEEIEAWLAEKNGISADTPVFDLRTPSGDFRRTSKMMKKDLAAARKTWLEEAETDEEREEREASDFLTYQNANGEFADFHANRHTFITRLSRSGIALGIAQKLARHSDPRLTANRYTHLEIEEKAAAISTIPNPVRDSGNSDGNGQAGEDEEEEGGSEPPKNIGPLSKDDSGRDRCLVAVMVAGKSASEQQSLTQPVTARHDDSENHRSHNPNAAKSLHKKSPENQGSFEARPVGFEPTTLGSEDRCAIQLRHGRKPLLNNEFDKSQNRVNFSNDTRYDTVRLLVHPAYLRPIRSLLSSKSPCRNPSRPPQASHFPTPERVWGEEDSREDALLRTLG
jgi:integrase